MLKKVWNSCKVFIFLAGSFSFAQSNAADSTASSSISMPQMPSVSMPAIGSGFYTPGRSDFYNPNLSRTQTSSSKSTNTGSNSQTSSKTDSSAAVTMQNQSAASAQNLKTASQSVSSSLNQLTADDISSLSTLGAFSGLSALLSRNSSTLQTNTLTANTADSKALQQILSELTELKNKVDTLQASETSFSNVVKREPKILRFNANGFDLLPTCKKIYFSELETDGTFLLTGDRKYMSENKTRTETFYFYFRAKGTDNGITKYSVTPAVSQDYENQYSYLYQLTQKSELTANRTGNLVTLKISEQNLKLDLLISLDK
ncbi:hypothetical protein [Treponema sp.]|uniref:hypothetical protein n=1 Tax=Treponema sp. TaxID=166 RepID=UPI00388DED84